MMYYVFYDDPPVGVYFTMVNMSPGKDLINIWQETKKLKHNRSRGPPVERIQLQVACYISAMVQLYSLVWS